MKKAILLLVCLALSEAIFAIYPSVHNFSRKESNAGTQNWDIIQTANNWMYFANNKGLLEYDGYHWSLYPIANYTNVRSLFYNQGEERIYAGAFNEFGYYQRDDRGLLRYHSLSQLLAPGDRNFNEIWRIHQNSDQLFFQGDREIFCMKDEQIKKLNFPHKIEHSGIVHDILMIATMEDGILTLTGDLFIALPGGDLLKHKKVCAILPVNTQDILFVTALNGMYIYNGSQVIPYTTDIDAFLYENQVFCAELSGSQLALGTIRNGVVIKDLKTNQTIYTNVASGLQNNTVLSLYFDRQDNLWLGLDKGIDYVMINSSIYNLFGNDRLYGSGYCSIVKGDKLYLGTNQGLYVTAFPIPTSPEPFKIQLVDHVIGQVWSLTEIDETLFCCTDRGVFVVQKDHAGQIPKIDGTWKIIPLQRHPGYLLGSSYEGFFLLKKDGNQWKLVNRVSGFNESGGMFEEDRDGNIWFSHWIKGISRLTFNPEMTQFTVEAFGTNKGLYTDHNNVISKINDEIVISSDGGFFRYDAEKNALVHDSRYEDLFGIRPYSLRLTQMPSGDIWCVSPDYCVVAHKQKEGTYVVDNTSFFSSLKNNLIIGFENFNVADRMHIIASTENGFAWLNKDKGMQKDVNSFFQVMIEKVILTNEKDSTVSGFLPVSATTPEFRYNQNSIRFEFVAPEFRDMHAVTYSYLLENYDSDWSSYSESNTKEYTKLPEGTYIFHVRAFNSLDSQTVETAYKFTILPPWYKSIVFIILYFLILVACIVWLFRYLKKRSEAGAREMAMQKDKEMQAQKELFKADAKEKEKEIVALKNQRLQYELRHKSQELANSTMNVIRKNEILLELNFDIEKMYEEIKKPDTTKAVQGIKKRLQSMQQEIKQNIERDDNWKKFEENFDMIYENYLKRLKEQYSSLSKSDLKLCAYLK
ncbi:MAG: hypothetical protein LBN18_00435, partial [Dysgonamonadaceae bacterium]|nr:hypothetical protein [Dysgonamonadaceae bacterium]